ncbi:MAG: hypothetical protein D6711_11375, partial [Chloroflexi bacterium]
ILKPLGLLFILLMLITPLHAQDFTTDGDDLQVVSAEVITTTDLFGQTVQLIQGEITNTGAVAYSNINIFADLLNADGEVIGEGFGFPVNACGSGLVQDFALQPEAVQHYSLTIEFFGEESEIASIVFYPEGTQTEPQTREPMSIEHVMQIDDQEVVSVEWLDENKLRFGVGCDADVFTYLDWYEADLTSGEVTAIEHPNADRITEQFLANLRIEDEFEYRRSFLTFAPRSGRVVFQSAVNHFYTAAPDGTGRAFIWDNISRHSLHGIIWQDNDVFLAYYYGAYGEDVLYFTASATAGRISRSIYIGAPSEIVPGVNTFGTHVVIATTFDDITGYWYRHVFLTDRELLFETDELPGNNWPAPIYEDVLTDDPIIYLARPVEGEPRLQCFNMDTDTLTDLSALPLDLTTDDRAWMWLSPEGNQIALAQNGIHSGLWVIDLTELPPCE